VVTKTFMNSWKCFLMILACMVIRKTILINYKNVYRGVEWMASPLTHRNVFSMLFLMHFWGI
jgi:hypothetical protein